MRPKAMTTVPVIATAEEIIRLHVEYFRCLTQRILLTFLRSFTDLNEAESRRLYELCSQSPESPATFHLIGLCHEYGKGVPQDESRAVEWYTRGADSGDPCALLHLACCHLAGNGVPRDTDVALTLFRRSAEAGNPTAMYEIGLRHHNRLAFVGDETAEATLALEWFRRSATAGNPDAMYKVGRYYRDGLAGLPVDPVVSREWFQRSADLGHDGALVEIATLLTAEAREGTDEVIIRLYEESIKGALFPDERRETLDGFLRTRSDRLAGIRYYHRAHEASPTDGHREKMLEHLGTDDRDLELVRRWRGLEDRNRARETELQALRDENERLRTELDYRPGGVGFEQARTDFEALSGSRDLDPPSPSL